MWCFQPSSERLCTFAFKHECIENETYMVEDHCFGRAPQSLCPRCHWVFIEAHPPPPSPPLGSCQREAETGRDECTFDLSEAPLLLLLSSSLLLSLAGELSELSLSTAVLSVLSSGPRPSKLGLVPRGSWLIVAAAPEGHAACGVLDPAPLIGFLH